MIPIILNYIGIKLLLLLSILLITFYKYVYLTWNYFNKQNVKCVRGLPILGSHWKSILRLKSLGDDWMDIYNRYPNERFIGIYGVFGTPNYFVRDPELIKQITIKDFEHFTNHLMDIKEDSDVLMCRTLFNMRDQRWKDMRATLSPTFTGSKMKLMFQLITNETKRFSVFMKKDDKSGLGKEYELRNLFGRLSSDTIASVSFGIENDSLSDPSNIFFRIGTSIADHGLKIFIYKVIPKFCNFMKIGIFLKEDLAFFQKLAKDNIAYREKSKIKRNDMIDLLVDAKNGVIKYTSDAKDENIGYATVDESYMTAVDKNAIAKWSEDDLAAQCLAFFLTGFNGLTVFSAYAIHELAVNQTVQNKLFKEISEVEQQLNGKTVTYEVIQNMKYLDMVLTETLRKWALPTTDRLVKKSYVMQKYNGEKVRLYPGDGLWLPMQPIHLDEKYYPNPRKFDPERFSDENKSNIVSGSFSPFGTGPHSCIASRFAIMQSKAVVYQIVLQFHIERCSKTLDPLPMKCGTSITEAGGDGFWVKFRPRGK